MKYIIAIDIGGTTFNTGIFSESFNEIAISDKDKIDWFKFITSNDKLYDKDANQNQTKSEIKQKTI